MNWHRIVEHSVEQRNSTSTLMHGNIAAMTVAVDQRIFIPATFVRTYATTAHHLFHGGQIVADIESVDFRVTTAKNRQLSTTNNKRRRTPKRRYLKTKLRLFLRATRRLPPRSTGWPRKHCSSIIFCCKLCNFYEFAPI